MYRLIIGYGNPLRCDDGVGWFLANQLSTIGDGDAVRIIAAHQLTPEMAETVSQASEVLFVDAAVGDERGAWMVQPVQPNPAESLSSLVHHLTPAALLTLTQVLYKTIPTGQILTVVGADFGYGETLSEVVDATLPDVQRYLLDFLEGIPLA